MVESSSLHEGCKEVIRQTGLEQARGDPPLASTLAHAG